MREMKNSGIPWIGDIPSCWKIEKLKHLATEPNSLIIDGDWIESNVIEDSGIRYFTTGNVGDGCFKEQGNGYISNGTFLALKCTMVYGGDLIFSRLNYPMGRSCIIPNTYKQCVVAVDNVVFRPNHNIDKRFLLFVSMCCGYQNENALIARGATMQRMSRTQLVNVFVPLAPYFEQQAIADFLDKKCAEIDAMISLQEKIIEELKAYKQSVISEAVTKGLNPNTTMKETELDWEPNVPNIWHRVFLKWYYDFEKGKNAARYTSEYVQQNIGIYPVYSGQTENDGIMGKIDTYEYEIDECLFTTTVGGKVMTPKILRGKFSLSQNCLIMKQRSNRVNNSFMYYLLLTLFTFEKSRIPTYMQPSLRVEDLKTYYFYIPTYQEQSLISDYLDKRASEIDSLVSLKLSKIEQLKEYKKSIIYEYVTGKKEVEA